MPGVRAQVGDARLAAVDVLEPDHLGREPHRAREVGGTGADVGDVDQLDHTGASRLDSDGDHSGCIQL